uniref:Uncharacterized protein n=1 Tax=Brassica oleracea TaxID=3712 RepID=A0A3P6BGV9_BRAOL|nr:unnamed protein product [Brassica oleracea]
MITPSPQCRRYILIMDGPTYHVLSMYVNCKGDYRPSPACNNENAVGVVRCILQMVVSDASDTAVFVAFDTTMTQLYLNLPVEAHTIQFLYKTSEMYYLKHLRSPPAQPLDDFSAQQGGNNHPDNDIPGAGSKVKSCTDVKNNVPVNMRCCNNGGALNGYARKLFRMRSLLFLSQPPNFHGLTDDRPTGEKAWTD